MKKFPAFSFALRIPGIQADFQRVDFNRLYKEDEQIHIDDPGKLREALAGLPRCTVDKKGKKEGDPLNLILSEEDLRMERTDLLDWEPIPLD